MAVLTEVERRAERVGGVSDVAYDLLAILTDKLEGIAALEEYMVDAEEAGDTAALATFRRLADRMREDVDELQSLLVERLRPAAAIAEDTIAVAQDDLGD